MRLTTCLLSPPLPPPQVGAIGETADNAGQLLPFAALVPEHQRTNISAVNLVDAVLGPLFASMVRLPGCARGWRRERGGWR